MRYPISILCAAALTLSGLGVVGTAAAAPAPQASPTAVQAVPDELVVGYVAGASADQRARARGLASAHLAERVVAAAADRAEVELVRLPQGKNRDQAVAQLQSDPAVSYAEPNWVYTHEGKPGGGGGNAPDYFSNGSLWGMYGDGSGAGTTNAYGSQAAEAWARGSTGSTDVYVGVIDEGIQWNHPDLAGQVNNPGETAGDTIDNDGNGYVDDIHGWDFVNNDNTIYDGGTRGSLDNHGTHVSGTIGARNEDTQNDVPVSGGSQVGVVGVNQHVTLISGKFLGRNGGTLANAVKAVDYFTDLKTKRGLNIVATNNSWGGGGFSQALLDAIVRAAKVNILFVAAAGNSGTDNDATPSYPSNYDTTDLRATPEPASYDAVIAVAAIESSGKLAYFSQYGATTVDLGAPGVGIWSTTAGSKYASYSGTSMATPHVTGAAALYASTHTATAEQIKAAILGSTVPTLSLKDKTVTGGRLNVSGF